MRAIVYETLETRAERCPRRHGGSFLSSAAPSAALGAVLDIPGNAEVLPPGDEGRANRRNADASFRSRCPSRPPLTADQRCLAHSGSLSFVPRSGVGGAWAIAAIALELSSGDREAGRMRGEFSGVRWACATIAPWCLASGLLMSFTAAADVDASAGGSRAVREMNRARHSYFVAGPGTADLAALIAPDVVVNRLRAPWLALPSDEDAEDGVPGSAPRTDLKRNMRDFPSVERATKSDPLIQLRPAFGQGSGHDGELAAATFGRTGPAGADERLSFEPGDPWTNQVIGTNSFVGWSVEDGSTARAPRGAFTSAADIVSATTRAKLTAGNPDGSTPAARSAVRLSSTTPAPPD